MKSRLLITLHISTILLVVSGCAQQVGESTESDDASVVLVEVDGAPITLAMLERVMVARDVPESDHERMRELLDELIRMQAVVNAARAEGLDDDPEVRAELRLARMQTLYRHYLNSAERTTALSEQEIRSVYDAQLEQSGDTQYRIEIIGYDDQSRALKDIKRLQDGEIEYSSLRAEAEASGQTIEQPGWIDRSQVPEDFAAVLVQTETGSVVPQPLKTGRGWVLMHVIEKRDLQAPDFEQVQEGIARSLQQQRRQALIESLYQQAEITPMLPLEQADPAAEE